MYMYSGQVLMLNVPIVWFIATLCAVYVHVQQLIVLNIVWGAYQAVCVCVEIHI